MFFCTLFFSWQDFVVVQSFSRVWLFATPWTAAGPCLSLSLSLLKLMSIESVVVFSHIIFCCPILFCPQFFPAPGSFPVSRLFPSGGQRIGVSASVLPMNIQGWFPLGWTGLISFLSKGLVKSLLQHCNSKVSILQCSGFFILQLAHPYTTTGKTIALTNRP